MSLPLSQGCHWNDSLSAWERAQAEAEMAAVCLPRVGGQACGFPPSPDPVDIVLEKEVLPL